MSAAAKDAVTAQVIAQTEQLLYIAYKLQLQELVQHLTDFAAAAKVKEYDKEKQPLLTNDMLLEVVYSAHVLEAAGYNDAAGRAAWVRKQLQSPLLGGPQPLLDFMPAQEDLGSPEPITFPFAARLQRLFDGLRQDSLVQARIFLLDGHVMLIGDDWPRDMHLALDVQHSA